MKLNGWIVLFAGMTLAPALPGADRTAILEKIVINTQKPTVDTPPTDCSTGRNAFITRVPAIILAKKLVP